MRLSQLAIGAEAIVRAVDLGSVGEGRRLQEIGIVPGTTVRAARRAPLGGPTVYEFRSTRIALRREGADLVEVEVSGHAVGSVAAGDAAPVEPSLRAVGLRRRRS